MNSPQPEPTMLDSISPDRRLSQAALSICRHMPPFWQLETLIASGLDLGRALAVLAASRAEPAGVSAHPRPAAVARLAAH